MKSENMFNSFDDISPSRAHSAINKYQVSNTQKTKQNQYTTYLLWIIVLLIFCLMAAVGISVVLWHELKLFQDEFHAKLEKNLDKQIEEVTENQAVSEASLRSILDVEVSLENLEASVKNLERRIL